MFVFTLLVGLIGAGIMIFPPYSGRNLFGLGIISVYTVLFAVSGGSVGLAAERLASKQAQDDSHRLYLTESGIDARQTCNSGCAGSGLHTLCNRWSEWESVQPGSFVAWLRYSVPGDPLPAGQTLSGMNCDLFNAEVRDEVLPDLPRGILVGISIEALSIAKCLE